MADKHTDKKQQAQFLYMSSGKTQKEIADMVGVSSRTVFSWIHQYSWDKMRLASFQAPATIADNMCSQIVELQNTIAAREPGFRYPTPQEAEVIRKLVVSLERMKKYPSLSVNMQVLETFRNYIRPIDKDFARDLGKYTTDFIEAKSVNGYAPYQVEYGVAPVSPVVPVYDEVEGLDANEQPQVLCPDHNTCLHVGKCNYPYCMKEKHRDITVDDYKVTPIAYIRSNASIAPSPLERVAERPAAEATGSNFATAANELPLIPNSKLPIPQPEATGSNFAVARHSFSDGGNEDAGSNFATSPSENDRAA